MELQTDILFVALSVLISIAVFGNYIYSIFFRGTQPHMYTWLIWCITQATAVAGVWHGNGGIGAIAFSVATFFVFTIFLLSFRYGTKNITLSDTIVLFLALFAIAIWWVFDEPFWSIVLVILIDFFGYIPSWRKSAEEPWSETLISWSLSPVGHVFAILALAEYNFFTLAYPFSIILANYILVSICLLNRRKVPRPAR